MKSLKWGLLFLLLSGASRAFAHPLDDYLAQTFRSQTNYQHKYSVPWATPMSQTLQELIKRKKLRNAGVCRFDVAEGFAILRFVGKELTAFLDAHPSLSQMVRLYYLFDAVLPSTFLHDGEEPWFTINYHREHLGHHITAKIVGLRARHPEASLEILAEAEECLRLSGQRHTIAYAAIVERASRILRMRPDMRYRVWWNGNRLTRFALGLVGKDCSLAVVNFARQLRGGTDVELRRLLGGGVN